MVNCSFCSKSIGKGTGTLYVLDEGKILNFCSTKCQKNLLKMNRKPVDFKWTGSYKKA